MIRRGFPVLDDGLPQVLVSDLKLIELRLPLCQLGLLVVLVQVEQFGAGTKMKRPAQPDLPNP